MWLKASYISKEAFLHISNVRNIDLLKKNKKKEDEVKVLDIAELINQASDL